jgi:hypothetical protein
MRMPTHIGIRRLARATLRAACGLIASLSCVLLIGSAPALAHHPASKGPADGIPIVNLTHGQMAVLVDYRSAILDLAGRQNRTDPTFQRLRNYAAIQYTYCFWGMMPGSIADEESPFNQCAHAYLAAARALLMHMLAGSPENAPVQTLARRIDDHMLRNAASLSLCRNSGEDFNTAALIRPDLGDMIAHAPTLAVLIALILAAACGALMLWRMTSGSPANPRTLSTNR